MTIRTGFMPVPNTSFLLARGRAPCHLAVTVENKTCVVADDHPAMLEALEVFLEPLGWRVITARDGLDALECLERERPPVAVIDIRMPRMSGIEVTREATARGLPTRIILYTGFGEQRLLTEALDAGARGFVLKEAPLGDLLRAIELVCSGRPYVDPVLAGAVTSAAGHRRGLPLSLREREVLCALAEGRTTERIAEDLEITADTVRTHVRKAMAKLEAETRTQAVATAIRQALIA